LKTLRVVSFVAALFVSGATAIAAQGNQGDYYLKLRLDVPFLSGSNANAFGNDDANGMTMFGGSIAVELYDRVAIELGSAFFFTLADEFSGDIFLRGGALFTLGDNGNAQGSGWVWQLAVLGGYRYLKFAEQVDGIDGVETNHCVSVAVTLETTRWFSTGFGINIRVLAGGSLPVYQTSNGDWSGTYHNNQASQFVTDLGLSIGVAF